MGKAIFELDDLWVTKKCEKCGEIYPIAGGCKCRISRHLEITRRQNFDKLKQNEIK